MKLKLPHKLQAALMAALASVSFTTLSSGSAFAAVTLTDISTWTGYDEDTATAVVGNTGADENPIQYGTIYSGSQSWNTSWAHVVTVDTASLLLSDKDLTIYAVNMKDTGAKVGYAEGVKITGTGDSRAVTMTSWSKESVGTQDINLTQYGTLTFVMNHDGNNAMVVDVYANGDFNNKLFTASQSNQKFTGYTVYSAETGTTGGKNKFSNKDNQASLTADANVGSYTVLGAGYANGSTVSTQDLQTYYNNITVLQWNGTANNDWSSTAKNWLKWGEGEAMAFTVSGAQALFGKGDELNKTVNVTDDSAVSVSAVKVLDNYTFNMTGNLNAGKITIAEGASLARTGSGTLSGTLSGAGTYILPDGTAVLGNVSLASDWVGTVRVSNYGNSNQQLENLINALDTTAQARVELTGVTGYLNNNLTADVIFTGSGEQGTGTALEIANGGSNATRSFTGTVSGNGDLLHSWGNASGTGNQTYKFSGNIAGWEGSFIAGVNASGQGKGNITLEILEEAQTVNADIRNERPTTMTLKITNSNAVTVNGNIIRSNGTLDVNVAANATFTGELVGLSKMTVGSGFTATIQNTAEIGTLSGTGNVAVGTAEAGAATGILRLSGSDTFTGNVVVNSGSTLSLLQANSLDTTGALTFESGSTLDLSHYHGTLSSTPVTVATAGSISGFSDGMYTAPTAPKGMEATVTLGGVGNNEIQLSYTVKDDAIMRLYILTGQSNSLGAVKGKPLPADLIAAYQSVGLLWNGNMHKNRPAGADTNRYIENPDWQIVAPQEPGLTMDAGTYAGNPCMGPEYGFSYILENKGWTSLLGENDTLAVVKGSLDGGGNGYWLRDNNAYQTLLDNVKLSIQDAVTMGYKNIQLEGLMYLQGESNSDAETAVADTRFAAFLSYLTEDLNTWLATDGAPKGVTVTFADNAITGENFSKPAVSQKFLDAATSNGMINADKNGRGHVLTKDLEGIGDGLHFAGNSQLTIGARYAYAFAVQKGVNVGAVRGQDDSKNLNDAGAWWMEVLPGANEVATWDISSVSTVNNIADGQTLTVGGIKIDEVYNATATAKGQGSIAINGGAVSLGQHGINLVGGDLSITSAVTVRESQTWQAQNGHALAVNGTTTIDTGATLTLEDGLYLTFGYITGTGNLEIGTVTFDMDLDYMGTMAKASYISSKGSGANGYVNEVNLIDLTAGSGTISFTHGGGVNDITKRGGLADCTLALGDNNQTLKVTMPSTAPKTVYFTRSGEVVYTADDDGENGIYNATELVLGGQQDSPATLTLSTALKSGVTIKSEGLGGTVKIDSNVVLNASSLETDGAPVTIAGSGEYVGKTLGAVGSVTAANVLGQGVSLSNDWKGAVVLSGGNDSFSGYTSMGNLADFYKTGSTIVFNGMYAHFSDSYTVAANIEFRGTGVDGTGAALTYTAGNQKTDEFSGTITGKGDFVFDKNGGSAETIKFTGNIAGWTGSITTGNHSSGALNLTFGGSVTDVHAAITKGQNHPINVTVDATSAVSFNAALTNLNSLTVNANKSATITGGLTTASTTLKAGSTLTITGSDKTYNLGTVNTGTGTLDLVTSVSTGNMTVAAGSTLKLAGAGEGMLTVGGTLTLESGSRLDLARIFETQEAPVQVNLFQAAPKANSLLSVGGNSGDSGLLSGGLLGAATPAPGDYILATANSIGSLDGVELAGIAQGYTGTLKALDAGGSKQLILTLASTSNELIWNGPNGNWSYQSEDANWHTTAKPGESVAFTVGKDVRFDSNANAHTVTLTDGITAGTMTIDNGVSVTVSGGSNTLEVASIDGAGASLALDGGTVSVAQNSTVGSLSGSAGIQIAENATLTVGDASESTYSGEVSGAGSLTKEGAGTLTLDGANSYRGGTTVNAGTLVAGNANALGTGSVTVNADGTLEAAGNLTIGGTLSGAGNITYSGANAGTVTLNANYGGADNFTGTFTNTGAGDVTLSIPNAPQGGQSSHIKFDIVRAQDAGVVNLAVSTASALYSPDLHLYGTAEVNNITHRTTVSTLLHDNADVTATGTVLTGRLALVDETTEFTLSGANAMLNKGGDSHVYDAVVQGYGTFVVADGATQTLNKLNNTGQEFHGTLKATGTNSALTLNSALGSGTDLVAENGGKISLTSSVTGADEVNIGSTSTLALARQGEQALSVNNLTLASGSILDLSQLSISGSEMSPITLVKGGEIDDAHLSSVHVVFAQGVTPSEGYTLSKDANNNLVLTFAQSIDALIWDNNTTNEKWSTSQEDLNWHNAGKEHGSAYFTTDANVAFVNGTSTAQLQEAISAGTMTLEDGANLTVNTKEYTLTVTDLDTLGTPSLTKDGTGSATFGGSDEEGVTLSGLNVKVGSAEFAEKVTVDGTKRVYVADKGTTASAEFKGGLDYNGSDTYALAVYEGNGNQATLYGESDMGGRQIGIGKNAKLIIAENASVTSGGVKNSGNFESNGAVVLQDNATLTQQSGQFVTTDLTLGKGAVVNLNADNRDAMVATIGSISGEGEIHISSQNRNRTYNITGDIEDWTGAITQASTAGSMYLNISGTEVVNADITNSAKTNPASILTLNLKDDMTVNGKVTYTAVAPIDMNVGDNNTPAKVSFTDEVKVRNLNVANAGSSATFRGPTQINGTISGNGEMTVNSGSNTVTVEGANNLKGDTTVTDGTLQLNGGGSMGDVIVNGGEFNTTGAQAITLNSLSVTDGIAHVGNSGNVNLGTVSLSGGDLVLNTTVSAGSLTTTSDATLTFAGANMLTTTGDIDLSRGLKLDLSNITYRTDTSETQTITLATITESGDITLGGTYTFINSKTPEGTASFTLRDDGANHLVLDVVYLDVTDWPIDTKVSYTYTPQGEKEQVSCYDIKVGNTDPHGYNFSQPGGGVVEFNPLAFENDVYSDSHNIVMHSDTTIVVEEGKTVKLTGLLQGNGTGDNASGDLTKAGAGTLEMEINPVAVPGSNPQQNLYEGSVDVEEGTLHVVYKNTGAATNRSMLAAGKDEHVRVAKGATLELDYKTGISIPRGQRNDDPREGEDRSLILSASSEGAIIQNAYISEEGIRPDDARDGGRALIDDVYELQIGNINDTSQAVTIELADILVESVALNGTTTIDNSYISITSDMNINNDVGAPNKIQNHSTIDFSGYYGVVNNTDVDKTSKINSLIPGAAMLYGNNKVEVGSQENGGVSTRTITENNISYKSDQYKGMLLYPAPENPLSLGVTLSDVDLPDDLTGYTFTLTFEGFNTSYVFGDESQWFDLEDTDLNVSLFMPQYTGGQWEEVVAGVRAMYDTGSGNTVFMFEHVVVPEPTTGTLSLLALAALAARRRRK